MKVFWIASLLFLSSPAAAQLPWSTPDEEQETLQGVWRSDGYGKLWLVSDDTVSGYHVTDSTCIRDSEPSFALNDFYNFVRISEDKNVLFTAGDPPAHSYRHTRLDALPASCGVSGSDPVAVFDTFVSYFDQHYPFFEVFDVDWASLSEEMRLSIKSDTSDRELFEILTRMLADVRDGHVSLTAQVNGEGERFRAEPGQMARRWEAEADGDRAELSRMVGQFHDGYWKTNVGQEILKGSGTVSRDGRIRYGITSKGVGYIAFVGLANFGDDETTDLDALNAILDDAIKSFMQFEVPGVIVDLSVNYGGYDVLGHAIASRFAQEDAVAYSKFAADAEVRASSQVTVKPSGRPTFVGPVAVLTSNITVSAGETLTLSLRSLSNVTHYGERTRGSFSDKLTKPLPNGWSVSLSNEIYTDAAGEIWEGRGIPPHVPLSVFDDAEPLQSHLRAIEVLEAHLTREEGD